MFLRSLRFERNGEIPDEYPFSIPVIATLDGIDFRSPVTFFAGENGTGKSTLLEGIAAGVGSVPVRGGDPLTARTLSHANVLATHLTLVWSKKTRHGFFLRAEDFFEYTKGISRLMEEMEETAQEFDARFTGYSRDLATGSVLGQRQALIERYGADPNARSHGESFLQFFGARFTGPGLYLLDEPDTALSPQSVLGLIAMLKQMVGEGAQFIIATHSAMLMAYPGASIVSFDRYPVAEVAYGQVEQIALLRDFLQNPQAFLRHL